MTKKPEDAFALLAAKWKAYGQSHFDGPELAALAEQIIRATNDAEKLGQLPYAVGNWNGSWRQVGNHAAAACEKLARAALALDPTNEAALYLYAQEDFLRSVNRSRKKDEQLSGPPVPKATPKEAVAKIRMILKQFVDGVHPLDIPSLETIPVDSAEVVDALIDGIECAEYRGGLKCVGALGRAEVELPRVVAALTKLLEARREYFVDKVAMAAHYGLKKKGGPLTAPLIAITAYLIGDLSESDSADYRHQWPLQAAMTVAPFAEPAERERARIYFEELLAARPSMPAWKQERLHELASEGPDLVASLARSAKK